MRKLKQSIHRIREWNSDFQDWGRGKWGVTNQWEKVLIKQNELFLEICSETLHL